MSTARRFHKGIAQLKSSMENQIQFLEKFKERNTAWSNFFNFKLFTGKGGTLLKDNSDANYVSILVDLILSWDDHLAAAIAFREGKSNVDYRKLHQDEARKFTDHAKHFFNVNNDEDLPDQDNLT